VSWELLKEFRKAAAEAGIKPIDDFNTGDNEGSCYFHVNQKFGRRWSAARGFLKPVLKRGNLRLETGCLVEGIDFDGKRASGVRWRQNGVRRSARCRGEVILAAGSLGSTQLLLLSGVGPVAQLREFGLPVVLDKPGVGENLQDHLQLRLIYKVSGVRTLNETYHSLFGRAGMGLNYALRRRGPLTMAPSQLGLFTRSDPRRERANLQFQVRRSVARVPGFHRERVQPAADEPRLRAASFDRSGGGAGDQAELSFDRRGPARRRRFDQGRAPHRCAAGAREISSRGISAGARRCPRR
jgi:choline dehydrogenase-like flavoprotein